MNFLKGLKDIFKYFVFVIIIAIFNEVYNIDSEFIKILENLGLMLYMFIWYEKDLTEDLNNFKSNYKKILKRSFKHFMICFLLMVITNLIIVYFINGGISPTEKLNREIVKEMPIYAIFVISLITPVCEELVFRLSFKNAFENKKISIFVTAFIFALFHVIFSIQNASSLLYLIPYLFLGLGFSTAYFKDKNIFASIFYHSINNLIGVIFILAL